MHGIIHVELKKFTESALGKEAWPQVQKEAGFPGRIYVALRAYPDEESVALVAAAQKLSGIPMPQLLEAFGKFLAPTLMNMYRSMVKSDWKTMELLLNTEGTIHKVVRVKEPGALPPKLGFTKIGPDELRFEYNSARRMAAVAKGMIQGVADHYGERVQFLEEDYRDDGSCTMRLKIS